MSETERLLEAGARARRHRRPTSARLIYSSAVTHAREVGPPLDLVRALSGLARIERDFARPAKARPLYEEAVALCREVGDSLPLAHTIRHLGQLHHGVGRIALAEECLVEALELYRDHGDPPPLDLANAIRPLAILWAEAGRSDEAAGLWREARNLYESLGIDGGVAEADSWLRRLA